MLKINKNAGLIFLILVSFFNLYISHRVYKSGLVQDEILRHINNNDYEVEWEFINNLEVELPNLSKSAVPLKALKGMYYISKDSVRVGFDLLYESFEDNPNIGYADANLALYYSALKAPDSAEKYARLAYSKIPNNAVHISVMLKHFANNNQVDSLLNFVGISKRKYISAVDYKVMLASLVNYKKSVKDSSKMIELAITTKNIFKNNKEIQLLSDYILHDIDDVNFAEDLNQKIDLSKKNYDKALKIVDSALFYRPNNYHYLNNKALIYFNMKKFKEAKNIFENLKEEGYSLDGVSNYALGLSYYNLREYRLCCESLKISINQQFSESINALKILCKQ